MKYAKKIGDIARYYRVYEILRSRFDIGARLLKCTLAIMSCPEYEKVIVARTGINPFRLRTIKISLWFQNEIRKSSLALRKLVLIQKRIMLDQFKKHKSRNDKKLSLV